MILYIKRKGLKAPCPSTTDTVFATTVTTATANREHEADHNYCGGAGSDGS